jgi:hypothetical protein
VLATANNPSELTRNLVRLVFISIFFVGMGVGGRLLFRRVLGNGK